jgi:hypothetical protein
VPVHFQFFQKKKKLRTVKIFTALNNIKGITAISDEEKIDGHTSP